MKCGIMQPTYLPWAGYFNLIASVDAFIFLDDVQFERRSWQSRNRILVNGAEHLISIPGTRVPQETRLADVRIHDKEPWRECHERTLTCAYRSAPHGAAMLNIVLPIILDRRFARLADLTIALIEEFCHALAISTPCRRSTQIGCGGKRSEHVAELCFAAGADTYLSPLGSRKYLEQDGFSHKYPLNLIYQDFVPAVYHQRTGSQFVSHLSIADVFANLGPVETKKYIER